MCLIAFAWKVHPDFPFILAANRDEFHDRPTEEARWWPDRPDLLAGRDLRAGGAWLAVSKSCRFASVTNYREQYFTRVQYRSRGELVTRFVSSNQSPAQFSLDIDGDDYAGFNLLTATHSTISYVSNRGDSETDLGPGVYGLSNASLDTPWSKLIRSKQRLTELIDADNVNETTLMNILEDRDTAIEDADADNLETDVARAVTAPFIVSEAYGTRCSTIMLCHSSGKTEFIERRYDPTGSETGRSRFSF